MNTSSRKSETEDLVFEHLSEPVEDVQDYVVGGLHPLYLGDTVGEGRYQILRKLGYGGYSTVWLAQDYRNDSFVALKVVRADSDCSNEVRCYDTLRAEMGQHQGQTCIMMLNDHFTIAGPNGRHTCLAYEVLGPNIPSLLEAVSSFREVAYLTLPSARRVIYETILGIDYMHSVGLVHGDIHAANVLLALQDLSQEPLYALVQSYEDVSVAVRRVNGPQQPGDPRYLTQVRPLTEFVSPYGNIKLADLGNSFLEGEAPDKAEMPLEIRSPEMILGQSISKAHDIWALGCLVYHLLTKQDLFELAFVYNEDARNDTHLIQLYALLGTIPPNLKSSWPRYGKYFNDAGQLKNFEVEDDSAPYLDFEKSAEDDSNSTTSDSGQSRNDDIEQEADGALPGSPTGHATDSEECLKHNLYPSIVKFFERKKRQEDSDFETVEDYVNCYPPLRKRWMERKHPDMDIEEAELILDMLQGLLSYDPKQRLSTKELLQHEWIRKYCLPPKNHQNILNDEPATAQGSKRKRSITEDQS